MNLKNKTLWFAKFTDHPKYTIEYEINEQSIKELIVPPTDVTITDYEIFKQNYYSANIVDIEIYDNNYYNVIRFVQDDDTDIFSPVVEHGMILGESYKEVLDEFTRQVLILVEEYLEWNDRERFVWYVECLRTVDISAADRYVSKYPELFV